MSVAKNKLSQLSPEFIANIEAFCGNIDNLYETFYRLAQTEHIYQQDKPEEWIRLLDSAKYYRRLATKRITSECGIDEDIIDDIFSDYFEDFANFREYKNKLTDSEFQNIIKKLIQ